MHVPCSKTGRGALGVLHIITGLNVGGAEGMLLKLIRAHRDAGIRSEIVSLSGLGVVGERMRQMGFEVHTIEAGSLRAAAMAVPRLVAIARRARPSVIQTWLPHADFAGAVIGALRPRIPVIWNIRMTDIAVERTTTRFIAQRVNKYLSRVSPTAIVCCAHEAAETYAGLGYARAKMIVIPNGFDLGIFKPDVMARTATREALDIGHDEPLIGIVGRFHPMKDHRSFVSAAAIVRARIPNAKFLMIGPGLERGNTELEKWLRDAAVEQICRCVGRRADLPALYSAMDLNVLSSRTGEGFPNVLGEAMACCVPCVATDVGGSGDIIGDTGRIVPRSEPTRLAEAIIELLQRSPDERRQLGRAARVRIEEKFSMHAVSRAYAELYERVSLSREIMA